MENFINTNLLPLDVSNYPWLYEEKNNCIKNYGDTGKWMLYYDNSLMNEAWLLAKKCYRENKLEGITSMKCSTLYNNPRALQSNDGIIILYCCNSSNEDSIMNIGKKMLDTLDYKKRKFIYYKTDEQTHDGTIATGSTKNHKYLLYNHLYNEKWVFRLQIEEETEEPQKIERYYPTKKEIKSYPDRYSLLEFEGFDKMNTDTKLQKDYKKWKDGINYKTDRKIKIGGKLHSELREKFMIILSETDGEYIGSVFFGDLTDINADEYLQETKNINDYIDKRNASIQDYNKLVDEIISKIEKLNNWSEYIEFRGRKYGLTNTIKNNIHIENNCYGKMIFTQKRTETGFHNTKIIYSIYRCDKCDYENIENNEKCSTCFSKLINKCETRSIITAECNNCKYNDRYKDRPFGYNRRFDFDECSCTSVMRDINTLVCENCELIMANLGVIYPQRGDGEFDWKDWKELTPQEKLLLYGVPKLQTLCENKGKRNYLKLSKLELIQCLISTVNEKDFPIKDINNI